MTDGVDIPITTPGGPEGAAVLRALAEAMKAVGVETQGAGEKASVAKSAFNFNEIKAAATTLAATVQRLGAAIIELSSEQGRLDANSARLGLDFNAAAEAAGRFTDETDAMASASRLAEAGIRLSQQELTSLTQVAARFAQNTGTTTASALDTLTNGLITGSQRGLRPFGAELAAAAGETHTVTDRLQALTEQARHTTRATDDAATSLARFKDNLEDAQRTMASGFVEGLTHMREVAATADRAAGATDSWTDHLHELGQAAGTAAAFIASSFNLAFEAVRYTAREIGSEVSMLAQMVAHPTQAGALRAAHEAGRGGRRSDLDAAVREHAAMTLDVFADRRSVDAPAAAGAAGGAVDMVFTEEELGSGRHGGRGGNRGDDAAARKTKYDAAAAALTAERSIAAAFAREAYERAARERHALDEMTTRLAAQESREKEKATRDAERAKAESPEGARAARETARLHREQQHRLDMTQTYTERMRDLHGQEVDSTQALAEGTTAAFAGMADAFGKHLQAFVTGKETIGDALQGMISDTLASIAQQATVKGALELAEGISALAGIVTAPLAPGHFAAAGAYFGVAALAGVGAAAVAPSSPSVAAPASAPREPAARLPKGGAASSEGGTVYNVTFGGPMYGTGGVRQAARQMVGAINRGAVQGGVQLLPGVLMGGGAGS